MSSTLTRIVQWTCLPVLLTVAALSSYAGRFELTLNIAGCLIAAVLVDRAVRARQYFWATAFVAIAIASSPFPLVDKIFLSLAFACIATSWAAISALRPRPVAAL